MRPLDVAMWCGFALAGAGLLWTFWPSPGIDQDYFARVRSTWGTRGPRVMIDEAHGNSHKANGRFRPFAHLLHRAGFRVVRNKQPFVPGLFAGVRVLVVGGGDGFDAEEGRAVREWVGSGGALLVAGEAPELAGAFGVQYRGRAEGGIAIEAHPIAAGRAELDERVATVTLAAVPSLSAPSGAVFLRRGEPVGIAIEHGKGRMVAVADAEALTARIEDGRPEGINARDSDNQQLALNILLWLSKVL